MSERVVRLPDETLMAKRLDAARLPLMQQGVLRHFIHSIAKQEETAESLVAAWESACEEGNKKFPLGVDLAVTRLLHAYTFPSVVDAIIPDKEVAADAKAELRFLEEIRA